MNNSIKILFAILIIALLTVPNNAQSKKEFSKTFDKKERVQISTVTGDCEIEKSNDDKIHILVKYTYHPDDYEIDFYEGDNSLDLEEDLYGRNPRGNSKWRVSIPDDVRLKVTSGTGNIKIENLKTDFTGNSGTGNIDMQNCSGSFDLNSGTGNIYGLSVQGEFKLNSGTGNVELKTVTGEFDLNSGTGDVEVDNLLFEKSSKLNSGTGDVYVRISSAPKDDVSINSGTGDAELNMNGIEPSGYFELECNADDGRIISDFDFDQEKEYWRRNELYLKKSFTKGDDSIKVKISSGTGKASLLE
ncbi:DUF4097 domain-containing protein [Bacteroidota bacterium]